MKMNWATAAHCTVEPEPDDTRFADSPPHALFFGGPGGYVLAVEGTAEELQAFAARVSASAAGLDRVVAP